MSKSYDLTTKEGLGNAAADYGIPIVLAAFGPVGWAAAGAYKLAKYYLDSDEKPTIKQQEEAAINIIKAGKENGAEEIEIELEQAAGMNVKGVFKNEAGAGSLNATLGKNGKMKLKVKYK
ncbi:hypothetical protein [Paraburkholderia tropica]|uniref:hypothetical protein n=1 Tax=Paraburkholderia tropica TaxID=92647 RepID=UPI002AAF21A7|nr:hypothetical protein [Paraburkholderia tropica]